MKLCCDLATFEGRQVCRSFFFFPFKKMNNALTLCLCFQPDASVCVAIPALTHFFPLSKCGCFKCTQVEHSHSSLSLFSLSFSFFFSLHVTTMMISFPLRPFCAIYIPQCVIEHKR